MAEPAFAFARDTPGFKVLVGGRELPTETALDIIDVKVCDYVEGASVFTVRFNIWDSSRQELKWLDEALLSEGVQVEVRIGFVDHFQTLIIGEITALEPEFHQTEAPALVIHGYDHLHRFRRGRKTRSFINLRDSQIAERIARDLKLRADVDDTQVVHDYVLQNNQTDIDFLLERARRIRYEVIVRNQILHFRKAANATGEVVSLEYGFTLQSFYPRLNTMRQVSEVVVQGWNPETKEPIVSQAGLGDEVSKMHGSQLGAAVTEQAFFATQSFIVNTPVFSATEATQIAKGKFNDMIIDFITGEGTAIGNTDIRAGRVIELQKLGRRFSGLYYVISSTHTVDQSGYITKFTVARNAT
jgi:phage protein D